MAEEKHGGASPWEPIMYIAGILIVLFILWVMNGGPKRDGGIRGFFVSPVPPVGSGESYEPRFNSETGNER